MTVDMDEAGDREDAKGKPQFYYAEQAQQTEFTCAKCGQYNDVRGRFAYCSACGWRNNRDEFRTKLDDIRERLNANALSPADSVKEAVSIFDSCCRDFATQVRKRIPMKPGRSKLLEQTFYEVDASAIQALKDVADIHLARSINQEDMQFFRLMMHRRHVHEHNGSVADERYVVESGDRHAQIGELLRDDKNSAHRFMNVLAKMVQNAEGDFHEIFPPEDWPVDYHKSVTEGLPKSTR